MYQIKYISSRDTYQIHSSRQGAFEGSIKEITLKAIKMGITQEELTLAYLDMAENKHSVAEFDIYGRYIFTKKK